MRSSMTGFRLIQAAQGFARLRPVFKKVAGVLAVSSVLAVSPAFTQEPAAASKVARKPGVAQTRGNAEAAAIPECFEVLKLSPQQHQQITQIIHNYDGSVAVVWQQFGDRYMQTIRMESSMLAAIEDSLTDAQRKQVRDLRRKTAKHEQATASTETKPNQAEAKPNEDTTKPPTTAEAGLAAVGVSLTDEQEAAADKVQEKYRAPLRSLNRDIEGLHTRLVSLEADKLVEIEKVLTKEQIAQLRMHRQNAPASHKMTLSKSESPKS